MKELIELVGGPQDGQLYELHPPDHCTIQEYRWVHDGREHRYQRAGRKATRIVDLLGVPTEVEVNLFALVKEVLV